MPLRSLLILVSVLCLVVSAVGWWTVGRAAGNLGSGGDFSLGQEKDGATDILLVGSDSRADAQGNPLTQEEIDLLRAGDEEATNTDTIIVIRVPNDGSSATAISIPRDTYISTAEGNKKINGVYGDKKLATAERLTGEGESPETVEKQSTESGRQALINAVADLTTPRSVCWASCCSPTPSAASTSASTPTSTMNSPAPTSMPAARPSAAPTR